MAFVKKTWKDRIVQYANRRLLTKSGGEVEQVTVTRDEGTISEAGDQFNASNMNNLEQRVKDGFDDLNAADLPIESGSATNTKDYIDSGLSDCAINYWSLFADQTTSNTIKTLDVVSGRKISDFTVLFAIVVRGGGERTSLLIPTGRFTNGIWVSLTEVDSANTQRWFEVKYVDDTHVTVQCSPNATGSEVYIYGLGNTGTYS